MMYSGGDFWRVAYSRVRRLWAARVAMFAGERAVVAVAVVGVVEGGCGWRIRRIASSKILYLVVNAGFSSDDDPNKVIGLVS